MTDVPSHSANIFLHGPTPSLCSPELGWVMLLWEAHNKLASWAARSLAQVDNGRGEQLFQNSLLN